MKNLLLFNAKTPNLVIINGIAFSFIFCQTIDNRLVITSNIIAKYGIYSCYSNNAMGLWSKVKGKGSQFRGPQPIGQVLIYMCFINAFLL